MTAIGRIPTTRILACLLVLSRVLLSTAHASDLPSGICVDTTAQAVQNFSVYFEPKSKEIRPRYEMVLKELVQYYRQMGQKVFIILRGNVDSAEIADAPSLDLERATTVQDFLMFGPGF